MLTLCQNAECCILQGLKDAGKATEGWTAMPTTPMPLFAMQYVSCRSVWKMTGCQGASENWDQAQEHPLNEHEDPHNSVAR